MVNMYYYFTFIRGATVQHFGGYSGFCFKYIIGPNYIMSLVSCQHNILPVPHILEGGLSGPCNFISVLP